MSFRSRFLALVPVVVLAAQLSAAAQNVVTDKRNGFQFQPPQGWTQVPIQVEEKWIATKWLSDKKYEDKESGFSHNPMMRVIIFPKDAGGDGKTDSGGGDAGGGTVKPGDEIDMSRPFVDYKDYLKRNFHDGGFFVSAENDIKIGETPVKMLEVKIEKLVRTGKKRIMCWVFTADWGSLAIEVDSLEQYFDKLQPTFLNAFKTFHLIARDPNAKKDDVDVGGGPKIKVIDPNETPEQQKKRRQEMEAKMFKKAVSDLPKDWTTTKTPHFLVLNHAGAKYQEKVIAHAEAVRGWLDSNFGDIGPGYVQGCIIRICKDRDEENAFSKGSSDSYSSDSRELVTSESKDGFSAYEFQYLGGGLMRYFFHDKNDDLYTALPTWLETGLREYIGTAVLKSGQLQFAGDDSEKQRMREGAQKNKFKPVRSMFEMTSKDMFSGEDGQYLYAECTSIVRYLMGPGRGVKKHSTLIKDYLKHLLEVVAENEKAARAATPKGEAKDEAAEEEEFKKRRKQDWSAKEKEFLQQVMKATFDSWTDADWAGLQSCWDKFAK